MPRYKSYNAYICLSKFNIQSYSSKHYFSPACKQYYVFRFCLPFYQWAASLLLMSNELSEKHLRTLSYHCGGSFTSIRLFKRFKVNYVFSALLKWDLAPLHPSLRSKYLFADSLYIPVYTSVNFADFTVVQNWK